MIKCQDILKKLNLHRILNREKPTIQNTLGGQIIINSANQRHLNILDLAILCYDILVDGF